MKQKIFILILIFFTCEICSAKIVNVELYSNCENNEDMKIGGKKNRSSQIFPTVVYDTDRNCLTITSPIIINSKVRVTNTKGDILVNEYLEISPEEQIIQLNNFIEKGTSSYYIEIKYEDTYLYGYITDI